MTRNIVVTMSLAVASALPQTVPGIERPQDQAQMAQLLSLLQHMSAGTQSGMGWECTIQQGETQHKVAATLRETVFVHTNSNHAKDALKAQAMAQGAYVGAAAAARGLARSMPMLAGMQMGLPMALRGFGGGSRGTTKGFQFHFVRGLSAATALAQAPFEIRLPPAVFSAAAAAQPMLFRLKTREKDGVRVIAAARLELKLARPSAFAAPGADPFERKTVGMEIESIPVVLEKTGDGSTTVRVGQALTPGEYALVLREPAEPFQVLDGVIEFRISN